MADTNALRTIFTYNLDGSTKTFNVAFDYLARKFVTVTLIGTDRKLLVQNVDYRFVSKTQIETTKAWSVADGYTSIEIRRYTDAKDRLVDFQDGSILRATDLNVSQVQTMHIAEEGRDIAGNTLGVNTEGSLDARGRKITNLLDGTNPSDAVTVRQNQDNDASALNSKIAAAASAAAALLSEQNSKTSETNSKTSETNAHASEVSASKWADTAEDTVIVSGRFSAMHWALKAAKSAAAALLSQNASKTSETNSKASETAAAASAASAASDAANLGNAVDLYAAVQDVNPTTHLVTFKGGVNAKESRFAAVTSDSAMYAPALELMNDSPFVDFHFGRSVADYTARIINSAANTLSFLGAAFYNFDGKVTSQTLETTGNVTFGGLLTTRNGITAGGSAVNLFSNVFVNSMPLMPSQGLALGWNESGSVGEAVLVNNHGGGTAGFVFRTVNSSNTVELGRVTFSAGGDIQCKSVSTNGLYSSGDIGCGTNIVAGGALYSGGAGGAVVASEGNIKGAQWGGAWLSNYVNSEANFMHTAGGRIRGWHGVGSGYIAIGIDGRDYAVHFTDSDRKFKSNIVTADTASAYDKVRGIAIRSFDMQSVGDPVHYDFGLVAQENVEALPTAFEFIGSEEDGHYSVRMLGLVGYLMGALQETQKRLEALEAKLK